MTEQLTSCNSISDYNQYENSSRIKLQNADLWEKFHSVKNEMIISRAGRKMFPVVELMISGLDQTAIYDVYLEFVPVDNNRWKYVNGDWSASGNSTNKIDSISYKHPESPNYGIHWMSKKISFDKIKLTNKWNQEGYIVLNSLHRYKTKVHVYSRIPSNQKFNIKTVLSCEFAVTTFFAVTAYQNEELKSLKIQYNPHAKSFIKFNTNRKIYEEEYEDGFNPLVIDIEPKYIAHNISSPANTSANSFNDSDVYSEESNYSMPSPHIERYPISNGNPRFISTPYEYQLHTSLNPYENCQQQYPYNQEVLSSSPYWHYFHNSATNSFEKLYSQHPYQQIPSQEHNTYYQPIDYSLCS